MKGGFLVRIEDILIERGEIDIYIKQLEMKIHQLETEAHGIGAVNYEGVSCTDTNKVSSRTETEALQRLEKIGELELLRDRAIHQKNMVDNALNILNEVEYTVIYTKYIMRMKNWYDVAEHVGYSYTWCMRVKASAFKKLSKIFR